MGACDGYAGYIAPLRITKETTLSQLGKMLAVEKHVENFAFVDEKTT